MKKIVLFYICFSYMSSFCLAQNPTQTIRGVILDANTRETLPGAHVVLVDKNRGTTTDIEGRFSFEEIPVGRYSLQISFVYREKELENIEIGKKKMIIRGSMR